MVPAEDDWLYARRAPGAKVLLRKAARATGAVVMREVKKPGFFNGDEVWMLRRGVMAVRIEDDLEVSCARARAGPGRIVKVNDMVARS